MKKSLVLLAVVLALGLAAADADAKRLGGGGNLGRQRPSPTLREAPKEAPSAAPAPANPAQATPAAPGAAPAAQPSFMSRWGGALAGLGVGALLGSLLGGNLGGGAGGLLLLLLIGGIAFFVFRAFASRQNPGARPVQFAGIGSAIAPAASIGADANASHATQAPRTTSADLPPGFEAEPFLRVAKTSFIRLQAANDAKDLDDIRDYTTPEMYAELAMQIGERGEAAQRTEVVTLDAQLAEAVVEGDYALASVRFSGLIRESAGQNPEPFDELWHVRKHLTDAKSAWLIAGIQQVG